MAIDGIDVVTGGLVRDSGDFASRLVSNGLMGSIETTPYKIGITRLFWLIAEQFRRRKG